MKKFFALFLSLVLFIGGVNIVSAQDSSFPDMPDKNFWSYNALNMAVENGLLSGAGGMLLPKDNLTRAQMATILVRAYNKTEKADLSEFTDMSADKWYYNSMAIAVKEGWFKGSGSGLLNPDKNITRQEVFVVLSRVLNFTVDSEASIKKFNDYDQIASWAKRETGALVLYGIINGSSDGGIHPLDNITREQFAQILYNASNLGYLNIKKTPTLIVVPPENTVEGGLTIVDSDENSSEFGVVHFGK